MRPMPSFAAAAPALVLLSSCVGPAEKPAPLAYARPAPAPGSTQRSLPSQRPADPPLAAAPEWNYRPVASGTWTYSIEQGGSRAAFGAPASEPRVVLRCDLSTRRISLIRAGKGHGAMTIRTSFGAQNWPATTSTAPHPQSIAIRAASDGALDQIAYSRGKFAVEVAGLDALILPAWAEVSRVIEDCRG